MASTPRTPRRGLPRTPGGEPWPPAGSSAPGAGDADGADAALAARDSDPRDGFGSEASADPHPVHAPGSVAPTSAPTPPASAEAETSPAPGSPEAEVPATPAPAVAGSMRRGLPREPGGEPWPPASAVPPIAARPGADAAPEDRAGIGSTEPARPVPASGSDSGADAGTPAPVTASVSGAEAPTVSTSGPGSDAATPAGEEAAGVRRGLPREPGGQPWPPASAVPPSAPRPGTAAEAENRGGIGELEPARPISGSGSDSGTDAETPAPATESGAASAADAVPAASSEEITRAPATSATPAPAADARSATPSPRPPLTVPRTVWPGAAARNRATTPARTQKRPPTAPPRAAAGTRLADFSPLQLLGSTAVLGVFALALVGIAVLVARFVLAIGPGREFLAAFPGEYHLPDSAPVGLPAWLNWSHFLNSFFLLLIIRTGWQVRREKRPAAFWSPRNNKKRRISLALWFHQALDILWIANGVIFVVLLFVTGQWMRIVPTSWEVFPNALSAALQYASLDWPTENGWVNYNSLQQLSYFAITFVAAPLAIISGVRLSGVWPKNAEKLNKLYPVEWARKVHFPTMLFFVAFIIVHVALVLATGALRNLNHMYAARGSEDPAAYTSDPTGLLIFAASLVVMAAAWVAARPAVLVPIARLFGEVKQR